MAVKVEFREFTPRNSREDLIRKLEQAPEQHAEALLSAYELLQKMHEKGLLDVANGLLGASETVVERVVDAASSKQAVTALRVVLMFSSLLESIDADKLHEILSRSEKDPPSLWSIGKQAISKDARRGLSAAVGLLNILGAGLKR